ncbi:MAG: hypothetical protein KTR25_05780 [Myxococcales bacterium]|nr:hypothetical protein [Myxococcales bacterium]
MARWWAPLGLIWLEWLLSAYVIEKKLPRELRDTASPVLTGAMITLPLLSMLLLAVLRRIDRRGDGYLIVLWGMTFFFVVHALVLSVVSGILPELHPSLMVATGIWLLGMGILLPLLPVGSPMGLHCRALVTNPGRWCHIHRWLGAGVVVSGVGLVGSGCFDQRSAIAVIVALLPALAAGIYAAHTVRTLTSLLNKSTE